MQEREQYSKSDFPRFIGFWTEERSLTVMLLLLVLHLFILTPVRFLSHVFYVISVFFLSLALFAEILTMVRQKALRWISNEALIGQTLPRNFDRPTRHSGNRNAA